MEQLAPYQRQNPALQLALMLRKVKVVLSRDEYEAFDKVLRNYLATQCPAQIADKALYCDVFHISEKKLRPYMMRMFTRLTLQLTMQQAYSLQLLCDYMIEALPEPMAYERGLCLRIIADIDKQTV